MTHLEHETKRHPAQKPHTKLWFRRKTYGWGWTPCTWQGWFAVLVYIVLVYAFVLVGSTTDSVTDRFFNCFLPLVFITIIFIELGYIKGETPKWSWGKPKNKEESDKK